MKQGLAAGALAAAIVAVASFALGASPLNKGDTPAQALVPQISLLHRAVIYAKEGSRKLIDGRWNLSQSEAKLGITFSAEQKRQLMACTGQIVCVEPGRPGRWSRFDELEPITASAVSVLRPDLLVTAQHVFFKGKSAAVSFESCSFRSFLHRRTAIPVRVEKDQRRGYVFNNEDFIVLRLKRPLQDCDAFAVGEPGSSLREGEQILSVTARQDRMLNKLSDREPVVAKGTIRKRFSGRAFGGPPFYYADVDFDVGGSGGAIFALRDGRPRFPHATRRRLLPLAGDQGRLILKGISVAYGLNAKSGKAYSEDRNFTILIGLEAEFRDVVEGKAQMEVVESAPCLCPEGNEAKIDVISAPAPVAQPETLSALLQGPCGQPPPGGDAGQANAVCSKLAKEMQELAKALRPAATGRSKAKYEFKLSNATGCPICFAYTRCNDYGCWEEALRLDAKSTLSAGIGERAPAVKNAQFCKSADAVPPLEIQSQASDAAPARPLRKPGQGLADAAESCDYAEASDAKFIAAKEKAKREGVHTLTSEDIRGLTLEQIRELRGY
ncbi:MAG TPA: serine protease [Methyloceanibacter sp.]|nr:serine protease [Methyloceanibacter sp.]